MQRSDAGEVSKRSGSSIRWRSSSDPLVHRVPKGLARRAGRGLGPLVLLLVVAVAGCTSPPGDGSEGGSPGSDGLSTYEEGALVVGRVLDNVPGCEVDGTCSLRIAFADTTVTGVYGTGERPAPPCEIARGVSDLAFTLRPGDRIRVDLRPCGDEGWLYIATLGS